MYNIEDHGLSVHADIDPDRLLTPEYCRAIRPNDAEAFIPVTARLQDWCEPGTQVWEYVDADDTTRGSLTVCEPYVTSPCWQISPVAGAPDEYYANFYTVQGSGYLDVWFHPSDGQAWEVGGHSFMLSDKEETPHHLVRGDTYRLQAQELGLSVLAIYPEAPFEDEYEQQVEVPDAQLQFKPLR